MLSGQVGKFIVTIKPLSKYKDIVKITIKSDNKEDIYFTSSKILDYIGNEFDKDRFLLYSRALIKLERDIASIMDYLLYNRELFKYYIIKLKQDSKSLDIIKQL